MRVGREIGEGGVERSEKWEKGEGTKIGSRHLGLSYGDAAAPRVYKHS